MPVTALSSFYSPKYKYNSYIIYLSDDLLLHIFMTLMLSLEPQEYLYYPTVLGLVCKDWYLIIHQYAPCLWAFIRCHLPSISPTMSNETMALAQSVSLRSVNAVRSRLYKSAGCALHIDLTVFELEKGPVADLLQEVALASKRWKSLSIAFVHCPAPSRLIRDFFDAITSNIPLLEELNLYWLCNRATIPVYTISNSVFKVAPRLTKATLSNVEALLPFEQLKSLTHFNASIPTGNKRVFPSGYNAPLTPLPLLKTLSLRGQNGAVSSPAPTLLNFIAPGTIVDGLGRTFSIMRLPALSTLHLANIGAEFVGILKVEKLETLKVAHTRCNISCCDIMELVQQAQSTLTIFVLLFRLPPISAAYLLEPCSKLQAVGLTLPMESATTVFDVLLQLKNLMHVDIIFLAEGIRIDGDAGALISSSFDYSCLPNFYDPRPTSTNEDEWRAAGRVVSLATQLISYILRKDEQTAVQVVVPRPFVKVLQASSAPLAANIERNQLPNPFANTIRLAAIHAGLCTKIPAAPDYYLLKPNTEVHSYPYHQRLLTPEEQAETIQKLRGPYHDYNQEQNDDLLKWRLQIREPWFLPTNLWTRCSLEPAWRMEHHQLEW